MNKDDFDDVYKSILEVKHFKLILYDVFVKFKLVINTDNRLNTQYINNIHIGCLRKNICL